MRVVFFGHEMAIVEELRQSCDLVAIYARPPRFRRAKPRDWLLRSFAVRRLLRAAHLDRSPRHRKWGRSLALYDMIDYARRWRIPLIQTPSIKHPDTRAALLALCPDLGVVANFGEILDRSVLEIPRHGCINFHPSSLPKYRGPSPLAHILLNGESTFGATWHQMTPRVDAGDILAQEELPVSAPATRSTLAERSIQAGARMLRPLLLSIERGTCAPRPQNEKEASYYPRPTAAQREQLRRLEQQRSRTPATNTCDAGLTRRPRQ